MVGGFVSAGLATPALAFALHHSLRPTRAGIVGPLLIAGAGLGLILMGAFENDCSDALEACKERRDRSATWHSIAHDVVSAPTFFCLVIGPVVSARRMLRVPRWRAFGKATLAFFPVIAAIMVIDGLEVADGWGGVVQRVHVGLVVCWAVAAALMAMRAAPGLTPLPTLPGGRAPGTGA